MTERIDALVGKFFHSYTKEKGIEKISRQGKVNALISDGLYLVETYDWMTGTNRIQKLITIDQMMKHRFVFYDSSEEMRYAYDPE